VLLLGGEGLGPHPPPKAHRNGTHRNTQKHRNACRVLVRGRRRRTQGQSAKCGAEGWGRFFAVRPQALGHTIRGISKRMHQSEMSRNTKLCLFEYPLKHDEY
jgi:hypothetical protein